MTSGHYVLYVQDKAQKWVRINDARVDKRFERFEDMRRLEMVVPLDVHDLLV